jgi:hypothetical protein
LNVICKQRSDEQAREDTHYFATSIAFMPHTTATSQLSSKTITLRNPFAIETIMRTPVATSASALGLTLDLSLDNKAPMIVLPESASALGLPVVRKQALHEAATNASAERKPVIAVELEFEGKAAIFEAVIDPSATKAVINPAFLKTLDLDRKN